MPPAALRASLESAALAGGGWGDVLALLAAATGVAVRLVAADGALLCEADADGVREFGGAEDFDAARQRVVADADVRRAFEAGGPVDVECLDGTSFTALSVSSGERRVGLVMARSAGSAGQVGSAGRAGRAGSAGSAGQLREAVTALAIVAVRRDAEAAAVAETASWFVDELRFGTARDPVDLHAVARRFGVDLGVAQLAVEIQYAGSDLRMFTTALTWLETPVRHDGPRAWTVCPADQPERVELIARRLSSMVRDGDVRVAAGPAAWDAGGIRTSFARAQFAVAHATVTGRTGAIMFADLGPLGLLSGLPRADLEAYVDARLGPLLDRPDLMATLREWFRAGGSWRAVAEATHIHRNSVGHRIDRIRSLLGVELTEPGTAFELQVALTALDVLAAR